MPTWLMADTFTVESSRCFRHLAMVSEYYMCVYVYFYIYVYVDIFAHMALMMWLLTYRLLFIYSLIYIPFFIDPIYAES